MPRTTPTHMVLNRRGFLRLEDARLGEQCLRFRFRRVPRDSASAASTSSYWSQTKGDRFVQEVHHCGFNRIVLVPEETLAYRLGAFCHTPEGVLPLKFAPLHDDLIGLNELHEKRSHSRGGALFLVVVGLVVWALDALGYRGQDGPACRSPPRATHTPSRGHPRALPSQCAVLGSGLVRASSERQELWWGLRPASP